MPNSLLLRPFLPAARVNARFWRRFALIAVAVLAPLGQAAAAPADATVRVGTLKFGTVSWELDVIKHHGFDRDAGIRVEALDLASNQATQVALQAGRVDAIVSDWFWVSRQRAEGGDWTFFPFSTGLGGLVVPAGSPITSLGDLKGRRLGIAGGPLDKSWLILRLLARQRLGTDLDALDNKVFGAPPLIGEQLQLGRLDAVLTYWPFVARLEAKGYRSVLSVGDALARLGLRHPIPMVGYVVSEHWARANATTLAGFVTATRRADALLDASDAEWQRIAPLTAARDAAELARLRDAFRAGIPRRWGAAERDDAARLYAKLAAIGGADLVGPSGTLEPGTFLDAVRY